MNNQEKLQREFNLTLVIATSILAFVGILTVWDKMMKTEVGFNLPFIISFIIAFLMGGLMLLLYRIYKKR